MRKAIYRGAVSTMLLGVLPATVLFWSAVIWTQEEGIPFLDVLMNNAVPLYVLSLAPALAVSVAHLRLTRVEHAVARSHPRLWSAATGAVLGLGLAVGTLLVLFGELTSLMWPAASWGALTGGIYGAVVQKQSSYGNSSELRA